MWIRGSAVDIATDYELSDQAVGVRVLVRSGTFASPFRTDRLWGPHILSNAYKGLFPPRIKRQWREADHLHPISAEVKKMWIYTSTPHTPLWRSAWLIKHSDKITFRRFFLCSSPHVTSFWTNRHRVRLWNTCYNYIHVPELFRFVYILTYDFIICYGSKFLGAHTERKASTEISQNWVWKICSLLTLQDRARNKCVQTVSR
jgi:hypothetical protein